MVFAMIIALIICCILVLVVADYLSGIYERIVTWFIDVFINDKSFSDYE